VRLRVRLARALEQRVQRGLERVAAALREAAAARARGGWGLRGGRG